MTAAPNLLLVDVEVRPQAQRVFIERCSELAASMKGIAKLGSEQELLEIVR